MTNDTTERVIVAANFTIESLGGPLRSWLAKIAPASRVEFVPYSQIFRQLLDTGSLFHSNRKGVNVIFLRLEDLVETRGADRDFVAGQMKAIAANASDFADWLGAAERFGAPLFVYLCPASAEFAADPLLGPEFVRLAEMIRERAEGVANLFVFGTEHVVSRYRLGAIDNPTGNVLGHIPYSNDFFAALAIETARGIDALRRKPFKALVLDCDNTIWDGIVGEDGVDGVGLSAKRLFLQRFAVAQSESGMIVCLCSKNNEADVLEVFAKRGDMILRREHIVTSRINWNPKSQNLRSMADELGLGLDSFVFVDDDPAVCGEVRRNCPEVSTVLLPEIDDFSGFFDQLWVFDKLKVTREDLGRTRSYREQAQRRELRSNAGSLADFLRGLELVCEISAMADDDLPRVSQLTMRTNQFNSTTVRLSESDVRRSVATESADILTVRVRDRFGDYGLVGVVMCRERAGALSVESFILSCRVLGRGVEHEIVRELGRRATAAKLEHVSIRFAPTAKNAPVRSFLEEFAGEFLCLDDDDRTTFRIPSSVALECVPGANAEPDAPAPAPAPRMTGDETGADASERGRFYYETAVALFADGVPNLDGVAGEVPRDGLATAFRAAGSATESALTVIWERLLGLRNVGVDDDFFDIGGNSLVAVALFAEIEEKFGRSLPLTSLIESPTIAALASLIDAGTSATAWKYLVPIQPNGSEQPLFCMHAAGGNVLFYRDLANELGDDRPVYGLQARGIADKAETAHDRLEEMAADYVAEIRRFQPHGPYLLCGSSFGGLVAFEAARQLRRSNEDIDLLAVFDTYAPGYLEANGLSHGPFFATVEFARRLRSLTAQLRRFESNRERVEFLFRKLRQISQRQKRKIIWKKNEFDIQYNKATGRELPTNMRRNHDAIKKAETDYRPARYDGDLVLIRASDQPKNVAFDSSLGWSAYVGGEILTDEVKGAHGAIAVYPFVVELAEKLRIFLKKRTAPKMPAPAIVNKKRPAEMIAGSPAVRT